MAEISGLAVRLAEIADLMALEGLAMRFRSDAFGTDPTGAQRTTYLTPSRSPASFRRALGGEATILVAVADGRIVGYAQFGPVTVREARASPADRSLDRIHIESSLRGRGVGRRLLLEALARPELAGAPRIFLRVSQHNPAALALYARLGFQHARARHFITGTTPGGDLVMVLERELDAGPARRPPA